MLVYFMAFWNILWLFGIIYGRLVQFAFICYIFTNLVCLEQEKSGNPERPGFGGMETPQKNPLRSGQLNFYN
jgi:hypothetical protein